MILATTKVEDYERFLAIFSTKGAEKRGQHGSKGATVFRDPSRGRPRLGALRLGYGGLAELRFRPGGSRGPPGGGAHRPAAGRGARRQLRRLTPPSIHRQHATKEPVMGSPAVKSPGYRKYVLRWDERPAAGTSEYEAIQSRILQVFREWSTPEGFTIHQFVIRVGDWGGYMVFETDNLADIHFLSTALAGFTFQLEPVIDVMDAVAVELQAMEWRASVA